MNDNKNSTYEREPLTETIIIPLHEYITLTKESSMLRVILSDPNYDHSYVVTAVAAAMQDKAEPGESQ